jgi:formylglycine-generating enzyme required for sulfatase activity
VQSFELAAGTHQLEISHEEYATQLDEVVITRSIDNLDLDYQLNLKPGVLKITLQPDTALLIVDGREVRGAYNEIAVAPGSAVQLVATLPGHTRYTSSVSLATKEEKELSITLLEQRGKIEVTATPEGEVRVNGKRVGQTPVHLDLLAVNQLIEVRKSGYRTVSKNITPQTGKTKSIHATLRSEKDARIAEAKPVMANSLGMQLRLFAPGKLELGAPRNEPGQKANEVFRKVEITRHFYLAEQLVTADQYAQFKPPTGSSGKQPAVQMSWVDAAEFCNWLSAKERLSPVYEFSAGQLVGVDSVADGYRLPTEAEWVWVARYGRYAKPPRYSWGNNLPVPKGAGNFADETAKAWVSVYIPQYKDGYSDLSPVGIFKANANGIYDIGGNAREWNHDFYELLPMRQPGLELDRLGPERGDGHVLRGSSWRTADMSTIRLAARAQGSDGADDVGFRVARWLGGY